MFGHDCSLMLIVKCRLSTPKIHLDTYATKASPLMEARPSRYPATNSEIWPEKPRKIHLRSIDGGLWSILMLRGTNGVPRKGV